MVLLILGSEKITLIYQNFENDGSAVNIFDQRDIEKKLGLFLISAQRCVLPISFPVDLLATEKETGKMDFCAVVKVVHGVGSQNFKS